MNPPSRALAKARGVSRAVDSRQRMEVYAKLGMLSTESFMKEKEVPQRAVVRVRRARPRSFLLGSPGGATPGFP